jgi:hypothetical protein
VEQTQYFGISVEAEEKKLPSATPASNWPISVAWNMAALLDHPDKARRDGYYQWVDDFVRDAQAILEVFKLPKTLEGFQVAKGFLLTRLSVLGLNGCFFVTWTR